MSPYRAHFDGLLQRQSRDRRSWGLRHRLRTNPDVDRWGPKLPSSRGCVAIHIFSSHHCFRMLRPHASICTLESMVSRFSISGVYIYIPRRLWTIGVQTRMRCRPEAESKSQDGMRRSRCGCGPPALDQQENIFPKTDLDHLFYATMMILRSLIVRLDGEGLCILSLLSFPSPLRNLS